MKGTAVLFFLLFSITNSLFAQKLMVGLRVNTLIDRQQTLESSIDTNIITPTRANKYSHYDGDLTFLKETSPNLYLAARFGFAYRETRVEELNLRQDNKGFAQRSKRTWSYAFRATFGVERTLFSEKTVRVAVGASLKYQHIGLSNNYLLVDYFDRNSELEYSLSEAYTEPGSHVLGFGLNSNLYYYILERIGLGLEIQHVFDYQWQKGSSYQTPLTLSESGKALPAFQLEEHHTAQSFLSSTFVILGIRFAIK